MSQRDREDQDRKQAAIDRLAQARSVLHERGNRISNDLQRELDALASPDGGRMIEHTGTTTDLTPPATGPISTTPAAAPPAPPTAANTPVSAMGGPVAAVAPIPATMPAGAGPPVHRVDTGGDPGSCEPGPGRFTAQQWNALPANDPRRTHETVVVDPPTAAGRHDNLVRISERTLGSSSRWPEIWTLNRGLAQPDGRPLASPSLIHPGDVLAVPRGPGTPGTTPEGQPAHPNPSKPDDLVAAKPQQPPAFDAGPAKTTGDGINVWLPGALIAGGALAAALAVCAPDDAPGGGQRGTRTAGANNRNPNGEGGWLPELAVPEALKRLRAPAAGDSDPGQRQRPIGEPLHTPSGSTSTYPRYAGQGSLPDRTPGWEQTGGHAGGWTPPQPRDPHNSQLPPAADSWPGGQPAPDVHHTPTASVLDVPGARSAPVRPVEQAVCATLGVRDDHTVGIDLTTTGGLHVTGPGALAATRALLLGLLGNTVAPQPAARIVINTAFARDLLGVEDSTLAALTAVEQLVLTEDIDQSLDLVEFEITRRVRQTTDKRELPAGGFAPIVLLTPHQAEHASRLTSVTAMGADFRCASITTHTHTHTDAGADVDGEAGAVEGSSVHVAVDGTVVIAVAPHDLAHALAGAQLFIASLEYTRDLLTGLTRSSQEAAGVASAAEPETTGDDPEAPETGQTATTSTASESPPPAPGPDPADAEGTEDEAALLRDAGQDHELDGTDARRTPRQQPLAEQPHSDEQRHDGHDEASASISNPTEASPGRPVATQDAVLAISCLGSFTVRARTQPGGEWRDITGRFSPLLRTLLAFLINQPEGAPADELLEVGWASTGYKAAQQRLQTAVSAIRRTCRHATGEQHTFIDRREDRYHLATSGVWVDYREFTQLVTHARGTGNQAERQVLLSRAADLYGGPPLVGIDTDWADTARHTAGRDATWVLTSLAALDTDPEQALALLERATRHDPADQTTARAVIEHALTLDRPKIAQRTYQRHADALTELGLDVDPALTAQLANLPTTPLPAADHERGDRPQGGNRDEQNRDEQGEGGGLAWPA